MVTVKAQCEASTVVVQMGGPRQTGGAGGQRILCCTLPPVLTGGLQTLTHGLLPALLPWWALGTQSTGLRGQQTRLPSTPYLEETHPGDTWGREAQTGTGSPERQGMNESVSFKLYYPGGGSREASKTLLQKGLSVKTERARQNLGVHQEER